MMFGGFTLFGFDLFGLAHRRQVNTSSVPAENTVAQKKSEDVKGETQKGLDHSESFFWGMYPVY